VKGGKKAMSEKKMVSRNVAFALGITCIILIAGLGGAFAYYMIDRDNTISALNSQISDKNNQISWLNTTATNLDNTVDNLNDIINLHKSEDVYNTSIFVTDPPFNGLDLPATFFDDMHTPIGFYGLSSSNNFVYSGYLIIQINSTSNDTYINYTCTSYFGIFNRQIDIGLNGTTILPVLPLANYYWDYPPSGSICMTVTTHTAVQAKMNITATYYY
jgi:hypothetical protein